MTVQTTISDQMDQYLEGQFAYPERPRAVDSGVAEAELKEGRFVKDGTAGKQKTVLTAQADVPTGVTLFKGAREPGNYAIGDHVPTMSLGYVVMYSETAGVKGAAVFARATTGAGGTEIGRIRNAAVGTETIDMTGKARYAEDLAAAGLVLVELLHL